jgi:ribosomal protein L37AE/L43A
LNSVPTDLPNVLSAEAATSIEKIKMLADLIAKAEDSRVETMEEIELKTKLKTGFLFCPRCGLRKLKDNDSKLCPNCGCKMIEEGALPYVSKSKMNKNDVHKNRIKEGSIMNTSNSIYGLMQQNQSNKNKKSLNRVSAIIKADSEDYSDAINELTEILNMNPKDINSYFARATARVRMGDIEGARQDFKMCENCHQNNNPELEDYPLV